MHILHFSILRNHISFLSNAPHIVKFKFQEIKNTVRVPSKMKLAKNPVFPQFQQIYRDFVICFESYVYFLASENN